MSADRGGPAIAQAAAVRLDQRVRYLLTVPEQTVPFYIDSIGYNPEQETIHRPDGYPAYHWIHTTAGTGEVRLAAGTCRLPPGHGILFLPRAPHSYQSAGGVWSTCFLTFDGPLVHAAMATLGIPFSTPLRFDPDGELARLLPALIADIARGEDITGLRHSADVYRFFVLLKKHAQSDSGASIHSLAERLAPLVRYLDLHYSDPGVSMALMAEQAGMSARRLNTVFRSAFGYTPYQYLLQLRIRKAKAFLLMDRSLTVQAVAAAVGFRDASHFIATFRKAERMTPEQYRALNGNAKA